MAPAYPIYMQIRSIITSLQTKKNIKNAKQDLLQVSVQAYSSSTASVLTPNDLQSQKLSKLSSPKSIETNPKTT